MIQYVVQLDKIVYEVSRFIQNQIMSRTFLYFQVDLFPIQVESGKKCNFRNRLLFRYSYVHILLENRFKRGATTGSFIHQVDLDPYDIVPGR